MENKVIDEIKTKPTSRYIAWEYCKKAFEQYKNKIISESEKELLAKELAVYLAVFGMYRASSFLLHCNHTIHKGCVEIVTKKEFSILFEDPFIMSKEQLEEFIKQFRKLYVELQEYYEQIREGVNNGNTQSGVSKILITKILMGVFGCCPAYDTYVCEKLSELGISRMQNNMPNLSALITYFQQKDKKNIVDESYTLLKEKDNCYTRMRTIDIILWDRNFSF